MLMLASCAVLLGGPDLKGLDDGRFADREPLFRRSAGTLAGRDRLASAHSFQARPRSPQRRSSFAAPVRCFTLLRRCHWLTNRW
jgi:hypothetical protein